MKRLFALVLILCMIISSCVFAASADPAEGQEGQAINVEGESAEGESAEGESAEGESEEGESADSEGESADSEGESSPLPGNEEEYSFDLIEPMEDSPLSGKELCILGSSVVFGFASEQNAVGEYLAARLGMNLTKEAVSGTTLVDKDSQSYIQRMLNNIDPEAAFDLFICQLSTNDATQEMPLGEISEGYTLEDFDTSTITGAIEYIICYARETWNCPIAFFTGSRYDSEGYENMVSRLLELKDKWDICVLDLWSDDAFNNLSEEDRTVYMFDDIHPTKAGYRDWWGPELESQLLDYLASLNELEEAA